MSFIFVYCLVFNFFFTLLYLSGFVAATVTPQHLILNRNSLFQGGLQPHNYCLPVLKREIHSMHLSVINYQFYISESDFPVKNLELLDSKDMNDMIHLWLKYSFSPLSQKSFYSWSHFHIYAKNFDTSKLCFLIS